MTIGLPPKPALRKLFAKSFLNNLSKIFHRDYGVFHHGPYFFNNEYLKGEHIWG